MTAIARNSNEAANRSPQRTPRQDDPPPSVEGGGGSEQVIIDTLVEADEGMQPVSDGVNVTRTSCEPGWLYEWVSVRVPGLGELPSLKSHANVPRAAGGLVVATNSTLAERLSPSAQPIGSEAVTLSSVGQQGGISTEVFSKSLQSPHST
jgi:hypothetical protein